MAMGNVSVIGTTAEISAAELLNLLADPEKYRKALQELNDAKKTALETMADAVERSKEAEAAEAKAKEAEEKAHTKYVETAAAISAQQSQLQKETEALLKWDAAVRKREEDVKAVEASLSTQAYNFDAYKAQESAKLDQRKDDLNNRKAALDTLEQELAARYEVTKKMEQDAVAAKKEAEEILAAAKEKVAQMMAVLK